MKRYFLLLGMTVALTACVTNIKPDVTQNPPPSERLANFQHFKLLPLTASADAKGNAEALQKIEGNLQTKLQPVISGWDSQGTDGRTLQIEPVVTQLKFVTTAGRIWGGAFAGSSAVVMKLRLVDASTGKVVADPEFYQRAAAMGGAYSFGGSDVGMLDRIATVSQEYLQHNYQQAVGGPTGLAAEAK
ncbi:hypothetical protein [Dyella flagellata]|uniref:DUF4410 domain-containing protein n=1 Tax=Dyella flagellata TaxID=1867833 RepID=A0ABQ5X5K6_9GAMM|nr:hypothetical protein [Dyella flagellata]GLQ86879.1 hypothetical protein GCM10007898_04450 [Dyella flagellata]